MIATIQHKGQEFKVDLSSAIDLSITLKNGEDNPNAWYVPPVKMEAVTMGDWIGQVSKGGSVNFFNIFFNPHGHGTHTECLGHISVQQESINDCLKTFFFMAQLCSVQTQKIGQDSVITKESLEGFLKNPTEALIIRTLPNDDDKLLRKYSNTNPPYLSKEAALLIRELDIKHLLIDLPSVDKEVDGGKLEAHHAFWDYPNKPRFDCTITELIYVPNTVPDGTYLLNLSIAPFENDASPSRPTLYPLLG